MAIKTTLINSFKTLLITIFLCLISYGFLVLVSTIIYSKPKIKIGEIITFTVKENLDEKNRDKLPILVNGWAYPETWGVWSLGETAELKLPVPKNNPEILFLHTRALVSDSHPRQRIQVSVNNTTLPEFILAKNSDNAIEISLPKEISKNETLTLKFTFPDRAKPKDLGIGNDNRELALGLIDAVYR